jgi:hypothetical protein
MVNFLQWKCRNCFHWHDWDTLMRSPTGPCLQFNYEDGTKCQCNDWGSVDNLIYLESLLDE